MEDIRAIDDRKAELPPALEALTFAWRPAGSMSLAERWLRAGESDAPVRAAPPRPPAPPKNLRLRPRRLKVR